MIFIFLDRIKNKYSIPFDAIQLYITFNFILTNAACHKRSKCSWIGISTAIALESNGSNSSWIFFQISGKHRNYPIQSWVKTQTVNHADEIATVHKGAVTNSEEFFPLIKLQSCSIQQQFIDSNMFHFGFVYSYAKICKW